MASQRLLVPSTSRQFRRCLHISAPCRATTPTSAQEEGSSGTNMKEQDKKSMEALQRLSRMPHYMRPTSVTNQDLMLGEYQVLRDTKSDSLLEKLAHKAAEAYLGWQSRKQIASSLGLKFPATWTGIGVAQSLREDAANAYIKLNDSFARNSLGSLGFKRLATDPCLKDLTTRREQLRQWDITWLCQQELDDLIGKSSIRNSKHLRIMGYRVGAAPDEKGDLSQIAQALVRFTTSQSLSATHKRQAGVEPVAAAPVELEPSSVTEYYIFQRFVQSPQSSWRMIKRVWPQEYAPAAHSKKSEAESLAAL